MAAASAAHGHNDVAAFHSLLRSITSPSNPRPARILALCGAGLSAASGLATFRGSTAALWHTHDPMQLATPEAFAADPALVWRFYAYRRHTALRAQPNAGHRALAALARACPPGVTEPNAERRGAGGVPTGFLCLTQNVDGLSPRAGHPPASLRTLHGSLFDLRCVEVDGGRCDYVEYGNVADPVCPALAVAADTDETAKSHAEQPPPPIPLSALPTCPRCKEQNRNLSPADGTPPLLRPGVVWFGEPLDEQLLDEIDWWIAGGDGDDADGEEDAAPERSAPPSRFGRFWSRSGRARSALTPPPLPPKSPNCVDLMLVIGTSAEVQPAASYIEEARDTGAVVATVNLDAETPEALAALAPGDFAFGGSAAELLPELLAPLIGKLEE